MAELASEGLPAMINSKARGKQIWRGCPELFNSTCIVIHMNERVLTLQCI